MGILRFLHREAHEVIIPGVDLFRRQGVQVSVQLRRKEAAMRIFVPQLDANLGALGIDEGCGFCAAHECYVVPRGNEFSAKERSVRGTENENFVGH